MENEQIMLGLTHETQAILKKKREEQGISWQVVAASLHYSDRAAAYNAFKGGNTSVSDVLKMMALVGLKTLDIKKPIGFSVRLAITAPQDEVFETLNTLLVAIRKAPLKEGAGRKAGSLINGASFQKFADEGGFSMRVVARNHWLYRDIRFNLLWAMMKTIKVEELSAEVEGASVIFSLT